MFYNRFVSDLQMNMTGLFKAQEQVSSGKRVNRPSDDPAAMANIVEINEKLGRYAQYRRNQGNALSRMEIAEAALGDVSDALTRAHELAVQMSNATYGAEDRRIAAREVRQLRNFVLGATHAQVAGQYVLSGYRTDQRPFDRTFVITGGVNDGLVVDAGGGDVAITLTAGTYTPDTLADEIETQLEAAFPGNTYEVAYDTTAEHFRIRNDAGNGAPAVLRWSLPGATAGATLGFSAVDGTVDAGAWADGDLTLQPTIGYLGDAGVLDAEVAEGVRLGITVPGDQAMGSIFTDLDAFITALENDDQAGVENAVDAMLTDIDTVMSARTDFGARMERIAVEEATVLDMELAFQAIRSGLEDADIAQSITEMTKRQTALQALRTSAGEVLGRSLFDFLR